MRTESAQELSALRQALHRLAEPSRMEVRTAQFVKERLAACAPQALYDQIAGTGLLAIWRGAGEGRKVLVRCELDGLPIPEGSHVPHGSTTPGVSHKCGHDGHMAILLGLAERLRAHPPERGVVALVFQPAEETGEGAARFLEDPRVRQLSPDWAFALHNLPGYPLGQVLLREGTFALASEGLICELLGETAHAAEPDRGRSPALAVAQLIQAWSGLPPPGAARDAHARSTVIHARLGSPAFGTTPGEATVMATLRAADGSTLERLMETAIELAAGIASEHELGHRMERVEPFPATTNHPGATRLVARAAAAVGLPMCTLEPPFGWSEDFGHFTDAFPGALFGLGAGADHPALHHPSYDFPDALIPAGVRLLTALVEAATSQEPLRNVRNTDDATDVVD